MKKCVLYDDKICDNCGECMRCDLDPNKLCDNCGKCLKKNDDEFLSIVVHAEDIEEKEDEFGFDEPEDDEGLTEEEKQWLVRIAKESELAKGGASQRGRRKK